MTSRAGSGRLVTRLAGTYALAETYHLDALRAEMRTLTDEASSVVRQATGLEPAGAPRVLVIGRSEWIERNVATFEHMTEPARRRLRERFSDHEKGERAGAMADRFFRTETSAVLGVLSRKVLGQYELVLPTGESGDHVAYVGPNVLHIERIHQFNPREFRYWVALHELTHRAQFQGVPWLRSHFLGLVEELVSQAKPEPGRLGRVLEEVARRRSEGVPLVDERGLFGLFASPRQSELIDRIQALMSLLEGHGHVVMDRVGRERLRTLERMSRALKTRRQDARTAAFFRLTGLEMKLKQYEMGERFVLAVEKEAGWDAVALAFRGAGSLPTLEEIKAPSTWLARVA